MTSLVDDLAALQRIPTVSSSEAALRRAEIWLERRLASLGVRRIPLPGPIVVAERKGDPTAPTVLVYGHYDVVATGPRDRWSVPPFSAVRTGQTLWGRGASDDKGPVVAGLHAVAKLTAIGRRVNLKFLYDGEEEVGSPTLSRSLGCLRAWLSDVDAVVICDTDSTMAGRPTLTCSLRGGLTLDLTATGVGRTLHPGRYGGAVPNPAQALAMVLASLHRRDGRVAVPGFYEGIHPPSPVTTVDHEARLAPVARPGWGEPGRTATERVTTRPAIMVTSLCTTPAAAHAIPAAAAAKLDVRLVPGQRPGQIAGMLASHLTANCPPGIRLDVQPFIRSEPWQLVDVRHPMLRVARESVQATWGIEPALVRSGGSIPAVPLLARVTPKAAVLLLGFTLPSDGAHSVDEHVDLRRMERAAQTLADLINRVGDLINRVGDLINRVGDL
ncbi:peptidase M20 [Kibdelosporangium aridum]|uniref:Peptidase M20 n=1 Tax=Kibdelosporangium aridum TaxID=2030 RepID=A0A428ZIU3_KIBAR|nr:M20/M25/M40 family metallo-hydrolase [Kibdelosporangium aridum]RSM87878.1 peptidase M20 [Kibdelosporangium aridum]